MSVHLVHGFGNLQGLVRNLLPLALGSVLSLKYLRGLLPLSVTELTCVQMWAMEPLRKKWWREKREEAEGEKSGGGKSSLQNWREKNSFRKKKTIRRQSIVEKVRRPAEQTRREKGSVVGSNEGWASSGTCYACSYLAHGTNQGRLKMVVASLGGFQTAV